MSEKEVRETPIEEVPQHEADSLIASMMNKNRQKAPESETIDFEEINDEQGEEFEDYSPGETSGEFTDQFGENNDARLNFFVETIWQVWKFAFEWGVPKLHEKQVYGRIDPSIIKAINTKAAKTRNADGKYQSVSTSDMTFEEAEALDRVSELEEWKKTINFSTDEGEQWKNALRQWALAEGWNIKLPPWFQMVVVTGTISASRVMPLFSYLASPPEKLKAKKENK